MLDWTIRDKDEVERDLILDNDAAMARYASEQNKPVIREYVYGKNYPVWLTFARFRGCDSRQPVIMRGSRYACFLRYSGSWGGMNDSPTHWGREIIGRYLRRYKFTCFDHDEFNSVVAPLIGRVNAKIGGMTRDYPSDVVPVPECDHWGSYSIWLNGRYIDCLTSHQRTYIRKLWNLAGRIEGLVGE